MEAARSITAMALVLALGTIRAAPGQDPTVVVPPPPRAMPAPAGPDDIPPDVLEIAPDEAERIEQARRDFGRVLQPGTGPDLDPARAAGLPDGSKPRRLSARYAYRIALIRARTPGAFEGDRLAVLDRLDEPADDADFARFRDEFVEGPGRDAFRDPGPAYFEALGTLGEAERARARLAAHERMKEILTVYARGGPAAGVTQRDVDRSDLARQRARRDYESALGRHRDALDRLRVGLGLPPDAPVVPDPAELAPLLGFFREFDGLLAATDLDEARFFPLFDRMPALADLAIGDVPLSRSDKAIGAPPELALRATEARRRAAGGDPGPAGDDEALRARRLVRTLIDLRRDYESARQRLFFTARELDDLIQALIAPPEAGPARPGRLFDSVGAHTDARGEVIRAQSDLIRLWAEYHAKRLELAGLLGLAPGDSWEEYLGPPAARGGNPR